MELHYRILRYLIDSTGNLTDKYMKLISAKGVTDMHFSVYNAKTTQFVDTAEGAIYFLAKQYFDTYHTIVTDAIILSEIHNNNNLNPSVKKELVEAIENIREYAVVDNEFEFLVDQLLDQYSKSYQNFIFMRTVDINNTKGAKEGLNYAVGALTNLQSTVSGSTTEEPAFVGSFLEAQLDILESGGSLRPNQVTWGFDTWDMSVGKMAAGDLIIMSGQPGAGKSLISHLVGYINAFNEDKLVIVCDNELTEGQNASRLLAWALDIPARRFNDDDGKRLDENDWEKIKLFKQTTLAERRKNLLFIPTKYSDDVASIRRQINLKIGTDKPNLIIVDYLDVMTANKTHTQAHDRIAAVTRELKQMALHYGCAVIAVTQPNREGNRSDVADLDMGALAYMTTQRQADMILFLVPDQLNPPIQPMSIYDKGIPGKVFVRVLKNRNGALPTLPFIIDVEYSTFTASDAGSVTAQDDLTVESKPANTRFPGKNLLSEFTSFKE